MLPDMLSDKSKETRQQVVAWKAANLLHNHAFKHLNSVHMAERDLVA